MSTIPQVYEKLQILFWTLGLTYTAETLLTETLVIIIAIKRNSQSDQKNKSATCATTIAADKHGTCGNRLRFQCIATTITIAAAPLGTIDVGTYRNKFNSNLKTTYEHSAFKVSRSPPSPRDYTGINCDHKAATCEMMYSGSPSRQLTLNWRDHYLSTGELVFGCQFLRSQKLGIGIEPSL